MKSSAQVFNDLLTCEWKQMMVLWLGYKCATHCPFIAPVWSIWWTLFRHYHHRPWRSITYVSWTLTAPWCPVFFEQLIAKLMYRTSPCHSSWKTNVSEPGCINVTTWPSLPACNQINGQLSVTWWKFFYYCTIQRLIAAVTNCFSWTWSWAC